MDSYKWKTGRSWLKFKLLYAGPPYFNVSDLLVALKNFVRMSLSCPSQAVQGPGEGAELVSQRVDGPQSPRLWSLRGRSATKET